MDNIKAILDEIASVGGSNMKMEILGEYKDNDLLKRVLYLAKSKRVKFYIKQIPEYQPDVDAMVDDSMLYDAIEDLQVLVKREITGNDAINHLSSILEQLTPDDAYVLERIIDKDLKIGMGTSNINKVFKGLIEKTPYQGAKSFSEKLARDIFKGGGRAYSDVKMDGRYCNAIIRDNEVELESRQGETTFVGNAKFMKELSLFHDCVLNGELTIDGYDRYTANGMVASIVDIEGKRQERGEKETAKKITGFENKHGSYVEALANIRYTVWDSIKVEEYFEKKSKKPYYKRREWVKGAIEKRDCSRVAFVESKEVFTYEEAIEHFQKVLHRGEEGTILKKSDAPWKDGKQSWQCKMKLEMSMDFKIIGFQYGNKGTKNENVISTLMVESSCGQLRTNPAGMSEDMMDDITTRQDELMGTIVEFRCCGLSQDSNGNWSTLHPSVVKLRDDKDTYDSLESAQLIESMAKGLKKDGLD